MIFGAGAIGLIFIRVMKYFGVQDVVVCETMERRRKDAIACEADLVLDPINDDLAECLIRRWGGLCDLAVDAVGAGLSRL